MDVKRLHSRIAELFPEHLEAVRRFMQMPSISHTGEGMAATADYCVKTIERLGGTAELVHLSEYPIVYGEIQVGAPRTIIVWGMYDVQPADEPDWIVPPFSAEIRDWENHGPCVIGRGAVNSKGPLQAFFNVVELIQKEDRLPVNLLFVIEGEEERGSPGMPKFVHAYADKLKRADVMLTPFFCQEPDGTPVMFLGVKGIIQATLTARGGDWGGPVSRDIHGGHAGWMNNPTWRLIHALGCMVGPDESILVEGFADDAIPPTDDDRRLLQELQGRFDPEGQLKINDVRRFKYEGTTTDLMTHLLFDPTCNISGLGAGYMGPGFKTLLPSQAVARIDVRLVPGMDPQRVTERINRHLEKHGFADVKFEVEQAYPASKVPVSNRFAQAILRMYAAHGQTPAVWPLMHGCAPLYLFSEVLNVPWVMAGLGHGARQHSSNEYVTVKGIQDFEESMVTTLDELARA